VAIFWKKKEEGFGLPVFEHGTVQESYFAYFPNYDLTFIVINPKLDTSDVDFGAPAAM